MEDAVRQALNRSRVIDITTTGRRTGQARRIEIYLHSIDGRLVISGIPSPARKRDWLANVEANPVLTVHLKGSIEADLPATARPITDRAERRTILERVAQAWHRSDVDMMVEHSPLMELTIEGYPGTS